MTNKLSPMNLVLLAGEYSISRLDPEQNIPDWCFGPGFHSITRTDSELSVICRSDRVPPEIKQGIGWRAIQVEGPLPFDLIGVLAGLLIPLADVQIPIFVVSTYETDYIFINTEFLKKSMRVLIEAGYQFQRSD
jgi:hypothetical protein